MGGRRSTTIINTSTTVKPKQPPAQPVVTSGRIAGVPTVYTIGAVRSVQPSPDLPSPMQRYTNPFTAFNSTPYIPYRPRTVVNTVTRPTPVVQTVISNDLGVAGEIKDEVCDEILSDPLSGVDSFTLGGNGKSTRFRFPESGAPSEIAVIDIGNNDAVIPSSQYNVLIRGDSVSWLLFDTAPPAGAVYRVKYIIGDSNYLRNVRAAGWTGWLTKLNRLQRQLITAKNNAQFNQNHRYGYQTFQSRVPETTSYDAAIDSAIQLKNLIAAPGRKMDLKSIETACNQLEQQLARLGAGTGKASQIDDTVDGPLVAPPAITRGTNIVFEFDDRYSQFSPSSGAFAYNGLLFDRQFDSQVGASYFDLNAGRRPPPPPRPFNYGGGGDDGGDNGRSYAPRSSPRPQRNPSRSGTGVTGNPGGVSSAEPESWSPPGPTTSLEDRFR